ncbi:hypothetical protein [Amycolatopsis alkalitolerans]|uniref:hypothetical protein n=1 Tax=Amycolatopsis alkalitolerans TaxID=2547244 RepID=UPI00190F6481|nr:hypothetical protein [Amycolatopsis alkalitolerans]
MRQSIVDWLDDAAGPDAPPTTPQKDDQNIPADRPGDGQPADNRPDVDLRPALGLLLGGARRGGGADGPGGGTGGGRAPGGGGRSSGGASRSLGRVSRAAGRAGRLALGYAAGDRQALERVGLDYDQLRALNDPVEIGYKIVEAAFETRPNGTVEDSEEREIVAAVVEWVLQSPDGHAPSPEEVVRKAIETIIADTVLTEVGKTIRENGSTQADRRAAEERVRDTAEVYAQQVTLTATGASEREMADAIENGIRELGRIFGVDS